MLMVGMAVEGMLVTVSTYLQHVLTFTAPEFAMIASLMTVTSVLGALLVHRLITSRGVQVPATAGAVLIGLAGLLLTWISTSRTSLGAVLVAMLLFGAGMSATFVSAQVSALADVGEEGSGLAAGLVDTSFAVGTALGVAVSGSIAARATAGSSAAGAGAVVAGDRAAFGFVVALALAAITVSVTLLRPLRPVAPPALDAESG